MELAGTREDLIGRLGWAAPHWGGLARSWKGRTRVLKSWHRLTVRLGLSGRRRRPWSRARGTEKSVLTHWLWPPSHRPAPHQAVSLRGPPAAGGPSPQGAVAAGTASQHQLPLRPRVPPLGGNGQRACTRIPPPRGRGGGWSGRLPHTFSHSSVGKESA